MLAARFNHLFAGSAPLTMLAVRFNGVLAYRAPLAMLTARFTHVLAGRSPLEMIAEHFNYVRVESSNPRGVSTLSPRARATRNVMRENIRGWAWDGGKS
jgi:hypothetical protein